MITIIVNVEVKPEFIEEFIKETKESQHNTLSLELGSIEYQIHQDLYDNTKFVLVESYMDEDAIEQHKTTKHFLDWRENVQKMMVGSRISNKYNGNL